MNTRNIITSRNSTFGYMTEGNEITILKRYLYSHVHYSITHNSQDMETTQVSIGRFMDKENVANFIFLGSKITEEGNCSHKIRRHLLLGRKVMTNLDRIFKPEMSLGQQRSI